MTPTKTKARKPDNFPLNRSERGVRARPFPFDATPSPWMAITLNLTTAQNICFGEGGLNFLIP